MIVCSKADFVASAFNQAHYDLNNDCSADALPTEKVKRTELSKICNCIGTFKMYKINVSSATPDT